MSLLELQQEIHRVNIANGWFDPEKPQRLFPEEVALIHSEISEAFEAYRDWGLEDMTEEPTEEGGLPKPQGVASELADVVVRLLDACTRSQISGADIEAMHEDALSEEHAEQIEEGIAGIKSMPFGSVISLLHREVSLIVANSPLPPREQIAAGLASTYTIINLICSAYDFDLIAEVERKVAYNATRGYRHGNKLV